MATSRAISLPIPPTQSVLDADRHDLLGLVLSAALPLAVFVIANGVAELNGILPLFFSPFGLPGWVVWCSPAVALVAALLAAAIWRFGVRHYRSTGS